MADFAPLQQAQPKIRLGSGPIISGARILPGIALFAIVTLSVFLIERQFGGPVILYALIAGMLIAPIATNSTFGRGTEFTASEILKIGIILLGARVTLVDLAGLGWQTAALVVAGVAFTLSVGWWIGRKLNLSSTHAMISASAVAICGASAALAVCAVLPKDRDREQNTVVTVLAVTALSTFAMVLYPVIAGVLGFDSQEAGVFIGVTIHNVAQVIGAGFLVSGEAAETATIVKLMRVACLVPAVVVISMLFARSNATQGGAKTPPMLPMFLIGFVVVMLINSAGLIPSNTTAIMATASHWALVMSVAALGAKTSFAQMAKVGPRCFAAMIAQTVALAIFAAVAIGLVMTF
ncbi:MAG: putative sulfate exporter family transporter [Pseudomonadota bacterium]